MKFTSKTKQFAEMSYSSKDLYFSASPVRGTWMINFGVNFAPSLREGLDIIFTRFTGMEAINLLRQMRFCRDKMNEQGDLPTKASAMDLSRLPDKIEASSIFCLYPEGTPYSTLTIVENPESDTERKAQTICILPREDLDGLTESLTEYLKAFHLLHLIK